MRSLIIIISACFLLVSCGVKSNPEYKSQEKFNKIINLV